MNLGQKIKERRILLQLTQEELANRCELTKGYISQLENDKVSPSIETLELILEVLGTNFSDFFHEQKKEIVFGSSQQYSKQFEGYRQIWLVPTSQELSMEPILVEIEPHRETFHDYAHIGEEFGYVIEGEIMIVYGDSKRICKTGESFYIQSNTMHYVINPNDVSAKIVWVSCPPNF